MNFFLIATTAGDNTKGQRDGSTDGKICTLISMEVAMDHMISLFLRFPRERLRETKFMVLKYSNMVLPYTDRAQLVFTILLASRC